ncbi:homoserine O-acetyltransferase MetX [Ornithinibacillus californiensis]|uniref:homoserine O-acetyltransferase MetX n=1 Tax=Ornithinibacillus californiensis TaxID=161536 RepID=UPI000A61EBAE|nr:homoserine O-acetyltransferase [Ornithinibacillus californiensis]
MVTHANLSIGEVNIGSLCLDSGIELPAVTLRYERVGPVDAPTILVCHALTGNHLTIGTPDEPGWWSGLVGYDLPVDTTKFQVITFNVLGSCYGSTGPSTINPFTNELYRMRFPKITIRDMVRAQHAALMKIGIPKLHAVIGGSLGGMQAFEWGLLYPSMVERLILLATTPSLSDYGIAYNHIAERVIKSDSLWRDGNYDNTEQIQGLEIARMIGLVTYRSASLFSERFGRQRREDNFSVASYLDYQGKKITQRFDPNSYLYLLDAMNSHDIGYGRGGWKEACQHYVCPILSISYENDLIYEPRSIAEFTSVTPNCSYHHVHTIYGHDGFLVEFDKWGPLIHDFINK